MIEKKTHFIEKRVSDTLKVLAGSGSLVVDIPFVPEYIKVKFIDADHTRAHDDLRYDILYTGNVNMPYQATITWSVAAGRPRRIKYTFAKLASFHNGVK
jgi:hypothetical protein